MPLRLDLIFLYFIEISDIFCFQVTKKIYFFVIFFFDHLSAKVPKSIFISRKMIKCVRSFNHTSKKKKKKANFIFFLKHKSFWKNKREREKLMVSPNNFLELICLHFTCIFFSDFFSQSVCWRRCKIFCVKRLVNRCTSILTKLSYQFLDWPKVVPWVVLWKNGFRFEVALKLWSRRAAQVY